MKKNIESTLHSPWNLITTHKTLIVIIICIIEDYPYYQNDARIIHRSEQLDFNTYSFGGVRNMVCRIHVSPLIS